MNSLNSLFSRSLHQIIHSFLKLMEKFEARGTLSLSLPCIVTFEFVETHVTTGELPTPALYYKTDSYGKFKFCILQFS